MPNNAQRAMEPPMTDEIIEITPDTVFFENPENKVLIEKFINHLSSLSSHAVIKDEFLIGIIKHLLLIIKAFKNQPEFFDKNCQVNIEYIKDNFILTIQYCMERSPDVNENDKLIGAFTDAYRFLSEAGMHVNRFNHELESVFGWVDLNIEKFTPGLITMLISGFMLATVKQDTERESRKDKSKRRENASEVASIFISYCMNI